jgi:phage shock protein A
MRYGFILALFLVSAFTTTVYAQESASAAESVEKLRAQLAEVQTKEQDLRTRLEQLEESLKPENIERSLAGVGSTRPEELREARRRQLTIERDGVSAQLKTLEEGKVRLEAALANAEARAYQQSARRPEPEQMMVVAGGVGYGWLMAGGGGFAALALAAGVLIYRRKLRER